MRKKSLRMVTCCLAGALLTAVPVYEVEAASASQYTKSVEGVESDSAAPAAGVTLAVANYLEDTAKQASDDEKSKASSKTADMKASEKKETKKDTKKKNTKTTDTKKKDTKETANATKTTEKTDKAASKKESAKKTETKKSDTKKTSDKKTAEKTAEKASKYDKIAVAQVDDYVNVRKQPNEDGELVGKLYSDSIATVLKKKGDWYKIKSGSVTGYVKGEYIVVGDKDLVKSVGTNVATVNTTTLKVRSKASKKSDVITLVPDGEELTVASMKQYDDGWVKVKVEDGKGYVSADYVDISTQYNYAESKAEEEARLAAEQAEREREERANAASDASASSDSGSGSDNSASTGSSTGQAVANYACQFLGNPYVWGGTSLTNGADCSGFVMSVYAHFGVYMPHSSYAQMGVGYGVSASSMQPGDIVCYGDHVAIYVGNNTIVHASNPSSGIKYTSPANYRSILAVRRVF